VRIIRISKRSALLHPVAERSPADTLASLLRWTRTSVLLATVRLLKAPGAAEVGMSRRPDLARPVELSVARRPSSSTASALLVDHSGSVEAALQTCLEKPRISRDCVRDPGAAGPHAQSHRYWRSCGCLCPKAVATRVVGDAEIVTAFAIGRWRERLLWRRSRRTGRPASRHTSRPRLPKSERCRISMWLSDKPAEIR
jgi:hypothetical protein